MAKVRTRKALLLTAILPLGLGLTACGDDDDGDDAASAFTVTAAADGDNYSFDGLPATIEGGTVTMTLDNTDGGDAPHEFQLVKVEEGTTFDDFKNDLLESEEEGAPFPDYVLDVGGGVGQVNPGASASTTQDLPEGFYVFFCSLTDEEAEDGDAPAHYDLGMEGTLSVEGDGADAEAPDTVGSASAKEYSFEFDGLEEGANSVELSNDGDEFHHFIGFPLADGATVEEAVEFLGSEEEPEGPPPLDFEGGVATAVLAPGQSITTDLTLASGTYVFACFLSDREGGPPHVAEGMVGSVDIE